LDPDIKNSTNVQIKTLDNLNSVFAYKLPTQNIYNYLKPVISIIV